MYAFDVGLILVGLLLWLVLSFGVAAVARTRGKEGAFWFVVALVASPLLALIFLIAIPPEQKSELQAGVRVKCSRCAEMILAEASVCRFCGAERTPA